MAKSKVNVKLNSTTADFGKSLRGAKFYERDVPKLIGVLDRIAEALEAQNKLNEKRLLLEKKKFFKGSPLIENTNE